MNDSVRAVASQVVADRRIAFVYQRYSLNNFAGLDVARRLRLPFVLEYNGSEIWMARHWGRPLIYESLASRIERLNVDAATLVVVVSDAMRDELVGRGVDPHRILVNPNAVDPDRYNPAVDGSAVTARYGLAGKTVIGFVGTFQPWHGAEVLARAFVRLMTDRPDYRESVRLLLIGSGPGLADVRDVLGGAGLDDHAAFAGLVPQEEGAAYMAACEILVSPHVPNPDGSRFFGSPTKLFEYMAMGKAILASDLEQIGNVLRHGVTGWLVPPGDVEALARALAGLVADPVLRRAMGEAARLEALAEHTWHAHVKRTLRALIARTATNAA
jgi:glycosyltransferase involved in cell wall biosynthesis